MIEIKKYEELKNEKSAVITQSEYEELLEIKKQALKLFNGLRTFVTESYKKNYACFGNGGVISYEELADLLQVKLPEVKYVGMEEYFKQREVEHGKE